MSETGAGNSGQADAIEADGLPSEGSFDPSLTCFILLAKFLGTPADSAQMIHDRGRGDDPWGVEDFARISKRLGLVAKIRTARLDELSKLPLPALAECRTGTNVILLKIEDASLKPRYLVQRGDAERPEIWTAEEGVERFSGRLLLLTSREAMPKTGHRQFTSPMVLSGRPAISKQWRSRRQGPRSEPPLVARTA